MSNSVFRGSLVIKRMTTGSSITAQLFSDRPLVQYLDDNSGVKNKWSIQDNQPTVTLRLSSSNSTDEIASDRVKNVRWSLDGVELSNGPDYEMTYKPVVSIKLKKDVFGANVHKTGVQLSVYFEVEDGGITSSMSAHIPITSSVASDSGYVGQIVADNYGRINDKHTSIQLTANLYSQGSALAESAFKVSWFTLTSNDTDGTADGRMDFGGTTHHNSKQVTVSNDDVELSEVYGAVFEVDGKVVDTAHYRVVDLTDNVSLQFDRETFVSANSKYPITVTASRSGNAVNIKSLQARVFAGSVAVGSEITGSIVTLENVKKGEVIIPVGIFSNQGVGTLSELNVEVEVTLA